MEQYILTRFMIITNVRLSILLVAEKSITYSTLFYILKRLIKNFESAVITGKYQTEVMTGWIEPVGRDAYIKGRG